MNGPSYHSLLPRRSSFLRPSLSQPPPPTVDVCCWIIQRVDPAYPPSSTERNPSSWPSTTPWRWRPAFHHVNTIHDLLTLAWSLGVNDVGSTSTSFYQLNHLQLPFASTHCRQLLPNSRRVAIVDIVMSDAAFTASLRSGTFLPIVESRKTKQHWTIHKRVKCRDHKQQSTGGMKRLGSDYYYNAINMGNESEYGGGGKVVGQLCFGYRLIEEKLWRRNRKSGRGWGGRSWNGRNQ